MTGDLTSYWQPDPDQPLRDWWFELDLGRIVTATRILLTFVDEDLGDPFLQYTLLTSDGERPEQGLRDVKGYVVVYASPGANKSQRVFDIELEPVRRRPRSALAGRPNPLRPARGDGK